MRTTTAYFAGVGTVVAAVAMGLGGGLLISNIVSPHEPRTEMSKLELRMSSKPIPVSNAPSEPVPYVAALQMPSRLSRSRRRRAKLSRPIIHRRFRMRRRLRQPRRANSWPHPKTRPPKRVTPM